MTFKTFLSAILMSLTSLAVQAQDTSQIARLDVLPGWRTAQGSIMAGFRLQLAPGWKTYWRAPGDAGIPPQVTWAGTRNVADVQFHWPVPEVSYQQGMRTIGYNDTVVIPIELSPEAANDLVYIAGAMNIGICDEICIPVTLSFSSTLSDTGPRPPALIAALLHQPVSAAKAGVRGISCAITPLDNGLQIAVSFHLAQQGQEDIIIEGGDPALWVSEPNVTRDGDHVTAVATMIHHDGTFALNRSEIRTTVLRNGSAIDIQGCSSVQN
jgi:DsbC/DsbD-like thiol-disulfide interchange protein